MSGDLGLMATYVGGAEILRRQTELAKGAFEIDGPCDVVILCTVGALNKARTGLPDTWDPATGDAYDDDVLAPIADVLIREYGMTPGEPFVVITTWNDDHNPTPAQAADVLEKAADLVNSGG